MPLTRRCGSIPRIIYLFRPSIRVLRSYFRDDYPRIFDWNLRCAFPPRRWKKDRLCKERAKRRLSQIGSPRRNGREAHDHAVRPFHGEFKSGDSKGMDPPVSRRRRKRREIMHALLTTAASFTAFVLIHILILYFTGPARFS